MKIKKNVSDTITKKGNDVLYRDSQTSHGRMEVGGAGIDSRVSMGLSVSGDVVHIERCLDLALRKRSVIS